MSTENKQPDAPAPKQAEPQADPPRAEDKKPDPKPDEGEPTWLPDRLERERSKVARETRETLLAEMGISDPSDVKKLVEDKRAADEAAKSEEQKREERIASLAKKADGADALMVSIEKYANSVKAGLTEAQREALEAVSSDPQRQLDALPALQRTWGEAPKSAAVEPLRNTSPAPNAPSDVNPGSPPDHAAQYKALTDPESESYNPFSAAMHLRQHGHRVFADQ